MNQAWSDVLASAPDDRSSAPPESPAPPRVADPARVEARLQQLRGHRVTEGAATPPPVPLSAGSGWANAAAPRWHWVVIAGAPCIVLLVELLLAALICA